MLNLAVVMHSCILDTFRSSTYDEQMYATLILLYLQGYFYLI